MYYITQIFSFARSVSFLVSVKENNNNKKRPKIGFKAQLPPNQAAGRPSKRQSIIPNPVHE